jgi:hypothetical protein
VAKAYHFIEKRAQNISGSYLVVFINILSFDLRILCA